MKKKPLVWLGGIAVIALVLYFGLGIFLGSVVRAGVNAFGPKLTKTKVDLNEAYISPFTGSGRLMGLAVGNPEGWSDHNAFSMGKIHVKLKPFSIFGDHIEIEEIFIDDAEFLYETKIISSNIKELLKNIESFTGSGGAEPAAKDGQPIKFTVEKFRLTNGVAKLGVGPAAIPVPLPTITLNNLGVGKGGITPDELVGAIMQSVLSDIAGATAKASLKAASSVGASATQAAGSGLKKIFGK
jgi:hypothetical protein